MNTRLALTGRHQWLRPALIVAALAAALAAYLFLAAPAAGRHRETLAAATAARNTAHGAAWDTRQAAADAAARERDQILRDGQAASAAYADEWREKVAKARAPHDKAAAAALEQNAADRVLAEQARAKPGQTGWDVEKVPEVVEREAGEKRTKVLNDCMASSGGSIFAGTDPACVKKADAAAEKHRATKDARIKAASAEHAKAIKAVEAAEAAQLKSYREWEAATAAADAAEAKVTGAGDPIVNAEKRAQKTYTDALAAADAALADAKASADAELADAQGRADLLRSVSTGAGLALAGAGVLAAAVLAWPFLTRGGQRVAQNERARRVPLTAAGIVRRFIDWETTGVIRFLAWRRQGKAGDPLQRTIRDALIRDLESGRMTSAEALKAHAQAGGGQALTGERTAARGAAYVLGASAVIWLAQILLKLGGFVAAAAPGTVAESGVQSTVTLVAHLAPVSWIAAAAVACALGIAAVGHAVTLDAPLPAVPVAGAAPAAADDTALGRYGVALGAVFGDKYRRAVRDKRVASPHVEPTTNGVRVIAPLPAADGVTADRFDRRTFAANVQRAPGLVRQVDNDEDLGTLTLLVMDQPPGPPQYPHTACATGDPHAPSPLGVTVDDRPVDVTLCDPRSGAVHAGVFGPTGSGKSFTARVLHLPLIRAQRHTVWVVDLKASAEWRAVAPALDRHVETVPEAVALAARARALVDERKGSRVTHDPVRLIVDETEPLRGQDGFWDDVRYIVKLGRAFNIGVTLCSQESTVEASGIPADIVRQLGAVWLGAGTRSALSNAVGMSMPDADLGRADTVGMGWLKRAGAPGRTLVRAYLVEDDEAARILGVEASADAYDEARADAAAAADDGVEAEEPDPLADLLDKMGDRSGMTMGEVREAIGDEAAEAVRKVTGSDKFRRGEATLRGVRRKDLEAAVNAGT